ncbi:IS66 family transposase, partial [Neptuniibacter sp.]|uniref:IS66 family transposase n=1 Tax=Neptuniibacter sp. TaxID=1962643 RepID=UPI002630BFEF
MTEDSLITAKSSDKELPNDVKVLKHMVLTLLGQIDDLQGQLLYLKRQMFGKKSEKFNPNQLLMFQDLYDEIQGKIDDQEDSPPKKPQKRTRPNANHKGRKPFPPDLPRDTVEIEPSQEEKICSDCGSEKQRMGEEVTEKLDYIPASIRVKRFVRPKYACQPCQGNISIADLPPMAIDKGIPAEGLLAHVITSKYADHLPLNRLEGILKRHGIDINVSTMCDWVARCSDLLAPLSERFRHTILESLKVHCDATVVPVKSKKRKGSTYNGYLWAYIGTSNDVYFDFTQTQSRAGPNAFFKDYQGYVQVDAHSSFNDLFKQGSNMIEVGCHAHARRKFDQAMDDDPIRSIQALLLWKKLYEIEPKAGDAPLSPEDLLGRRQEKSKPLFQELYRLIEQWQPLVL